MEDYQEVSLNKFREVIIFSFLFFTFLSGEIIRTNEFCSFVKIRQEKIKYRWLRFDDGWSYMFYWAGWLYKWRKV